MTLPSSPKSFGSSVLSRQVQWQHPKLVQSGIDQTRLAIADAPVGAEPFSFLVMGDTDAGVSGGAASDAEKSPFVEAFAQQVQSYAQESQFVLHTGDVTYPAGTYQNYFTGFLSPYQSLLSKLPSSPAYRSGEIVFNRPLLPVPGNHDYAKPAHINRLWLALQRRCCDLLRQRFGIDLGGYGGHGGEAYGQTFLDDLSRLSAGDLATHLASHYSASMSPSRASARSLPANPADGPAGRERTEAQAATYCLDYRPGQFTRLPNRYYTFHYGGIDFFALDSNTWNVAPETKGCDHEQLAWLERELIRSWRSPDVTGRIIYLHHSPYTTESYRWQQPDTLWVRQHLRGVFDRVALALSEREQSVPLVDVVISGHAHCLEHMKTAQTTYADSQMDWLVCGGSGFGLRRQRRMGKDLLENVFRRGRSETDVVAESQLYAGVHGSSRKQRKFHSFVRIDVQPHQPEKIVVCPFIVTMVDGKWQTKALASFAVGKPLTDYAKVKTSARVSA
ncbi:MAG: metallophosphoesterase [Cyanobacteria bacterium J06626_6]